MFGCAGPSLLHQLSLVAVSGGYSSLWCRGISSRWLLLWDVLSGAEVKNPPASAGDARDLGSVSGLGRCPGEGNRKPLQYSCLDNPMDKRACPWNRKELGTTEHAPRLVEL